MRPSDVYIGAADFFSSVVPGAITAFLLLTSGWIPEPPHWHQPAWGSPVGWVTFLVAAYILGHLLSAIGSIALDYFVYDQYYVPWKRKRVGSRYAHSDVYLKENCALDTREPIPDHELLKAAKTLKRQQLEEFSRAVEVSADDIGSTFRWAEAVVRVKDPAGATQVEGLMARSKMFRAITLLVPLGAAWCGLSSIVIGIGAALFLLCLWRFLDLRWEAVERTYEYFIVAALFEPESSKSQQVESSA